MANEQNKIIDIMVKEGFYPDANHAGRAIKRYIQLGKKFMSPMDWAKVWEGAEKNVVIPAPEEKKA
jgi:hypothetical protein